MCDLWLADERFTELAGERFEELADERFAGKKKNKKKTGRTL